MLLEWVLSLSSWRRLLEGSDEGSSSDKLCWDGNDRKVGGCRVVCGLSVGDVLVEEDEEEDGLDGEGQ